MKEEKGLFVQVFGLVLIHEEWEGHKNGGIRRLYFGKNLDSKEGRVINISGGKFCFGGTWKKQ